MTRHLSSQQIAECLMGTASQFELQHVAACDGCRAEVDSLARPLSLFRASFRHWSSRNNRQTSNVFETAPILLLMPKSMDRAWYSNIILEIREAIREAIHPAEHSPIKLTSKPVPLHELRIFAGATYAGNEARSGFASLAIHTGVIGLLIFLGSLKPVQMLVKQQVTSLEVDLRPYLSKQQRQTSGGGGGGGAREVIEASLGKLPKPAPRQFTPPRVDPILNPKLPMQATIVAPEDLPNLEANNFGDPLSRLGIPSNGTGFGGGIGSGTGGGVGLGKGHGFGPGEGGDFGGGVYRIGGGVSAPTILVKVEPEYSEEARKAKWQGEVGLMVIVDSNGNPVSIKVTRSLGLGLDEKAIEAVSKWRFKPAMKDGKPVAVSANIVVNFRLL